MTKKYLFILLISSYSLFAGNLVDSIFVQSNQLYSVGDFDAAARGYLSILNQDIDNKVLYYNLGNCYYKLENFGYARLYYEIAKLYNPRDKDVIHNLNVLQTQLIDDVQNISEFVFLRWVRSISILFSPSQWALLMIVLLYIALFLFLFFVLSKNIENKISSLRLFFISLILVILSVFFVFYSNGKTNDNYAVLISTNTYVKIAPSSSANDYFIIHEGLKFRIVDQLDGWSRILLSDGKDGWVENKHFLKIKK